MPYWSAAQLLAPLGSLRFRVITSVLVLASALFAFGATAQSPGLDDAPLVGPYFDGAFPLTNPGEGGTEVWRVVNAYPHLTFDDPLVYTPLAGTDRVFVASRGGIIHSFVNDPATTDKELCLDIESITAVVWDGGFLGMAFHPLFGQAAGKDHLYVYHSARPEDGSYPGGSTGGFFGTYLRLARYDVDPATYVADRESEVQLFNIRLYNGSHRGGGMEFGGDGMLYLSIGDQFRYETAQDIAGNFEGGIIRIDVDMDSTRSHPPRRFMGVDVGQSDEHSGNQYFIPNDNPFLDPAGEIFEEFWTLGNRAPHRMTYDAMTDRFWSGEVGNSQREEINIISGGNNYGWPFREGTIAGPRAEPDSIIGTLTEPVLDFPRSDARAIIGGYVYRGAEHPELYGKYVCGDYSTAKLFVITYDEQSGTGTREDLGTFDPGFLGTFGQDLDGEIYLCGLGPDRPIYKLAKVVTDGPAPATLSQTGFFTDLQLLEPSPAAIPYEINVPFWSDGAHKSRWAILPYDGSPELAEERIAFSAEATWAFPEGTVLVKHFDLPIDDMDPGVTRRIETRFLVNGFRGAVYGLSYRWRDDQSDADLLATGLDEDITITTVTGTRTQTWRYPSRSECLTCHNAASGYALGFNTRQLNRATTYPSTGRTDNQLVVLSAVGLLDPAVAPEDLDALPRLRDKDDGSAPLELRARSYLDANCSHCHQPGTGNRAAIDARISTPLVASGLVRGGLLDDLGVAGAEVIAPQDVDRSIAHRRMLTRDGTGLGMPPIASSVADSAGAELLARWIRLLDADHPTNVAFGKAATQSSTQSGRGASRAVDGNTDGNLSAGSVTETRSNANAWWQVDLGEVFAIDEVVLFNRTDCCSNRLRDFHLFVSEEPFASAELDMTLSDSTVAKFFHPGQAATRTGFALNVSGRYLRVQLQRTDRLNLAEVQVYSRAWNQPAIERPVLGNDAQVAGLADSTISNLVVNRSDVYENDESGFVHLRVDDFSFHAAALGDPVTPFLAEMDPSGGLTVVRVGSTRLPEEMKLGANSFSFDAIEPPVLRLAPGTVLVTGFLDARPDGSDGGVSPVVAYSEDAGADSVLWTGGPTGEDSGYVVVGASPLPGAQLLDGLRRDYRYQISFTRMQEPLTSVDAGPAPLDGRSPMRLASPAPNPFNPSTVLRLRLEAATEVDWAVFDVRGRRVLTLARGELPPGEHVRVWNGTDHQGAPVASGVYFQRVSAGDRSQTNKLVLVK